MGRVMTNAMMADSADEPHGMLSSGRWGDSTVERLYLSLSTNGLVSSAWVWHHLPAERDRTPTSATPGITRLSPGKNARPTYLERRPWVQCMRLSRDS